MKAEIVCIIDRSGSMLDIRGDAIGGFNSFIEDQKKVPGEATVTFVQFDTEYEVVYSGTPIQDVPELTSSTYVPRGATALRDAIGRTIDDVGARLNSIPQNDRPDKVIVVILTDGHENSSMSYSHEKVLEMIKHQREKYSWEFIYLGATEDAFDVGVSFGILVKDITKYAPTGDGIRAAYMSASVSASNYRSDSSGGGNNG